MEAAEAWLGSGFAWGICTGLAVHMLAVKLVVWLRWFSECK
jgi:hypothetical protein